jgi:hypothetical protein
MSASQSHRTTGNGYSVAIWHVDDHYVVQATADAFMPSKLLRPSAIRQTYGEARETAETWIDEYRKEVSNV